MLKTETLTVKTILFEGEKGKILAKNAFEKCKITLILGAFCT